jgi:endonuclease YncB( thermonuclease family)
MRSGNVVYILHARRRRALRRLLDVSAVPLTAVALFFLPLNHSADGSAFKTFSYRDNLPGGQAWGGIRGNGASANVLQGPVTHVRDGDTIEVSGKPVRIANLDCAERGTKAGKRATHQMQQLAAFGIVTCQMLGQYSYDRELGTCVLSDGRDMGAILITGGYCASW